MSRAEPAFLGDARLRLLLFGGKGGVGKTTCAAAAALARARADAEGRYLLVSTDPAHSLADALGSLAVPPNLEVLELDAAASLERFRTRNGSFLREIASRGTFLTDSEIDRFLALSLPGLDELMAFLELTGWVEAGTYRLIVVDTAPTGHALRLVEMPRLLRQWLLALDALLAKHRYMRAVFSGKKDRDGVDAFLEGLALSVKRVGTLLADPVSCRFVPVLVAERLSVLETRDLVAALTQSRVALSEAVVNRLRPASPCPVCTAARGRQEEELRLLLVEPAAAPLAFWGVPLLGGEVRGSGLDSFWSGASRLSLPERSVPVPVPVEEAPTVLRPLPPVLPATSLLVLAGKGGVGKTTLACAAALHLAERSPASRVLLVSTDPAHSVADALGVAVGAAPVTVTEGLDAMEIDSAAGLEVFKLRYAEEIERFLGGILKGFDITFDREVLERLMDLSPPGLDEVMAVAALMDVFASKRYGLVVLDSAPTGHLVRLLEAPELVEGWVRAFFELLLRYRTVLRLPETTKALVTLSKNLKALRSLIADPARCGLFAVSIPTELALAETVDLVAACRRVGIAVRGLALNMVPPRGESCPLCLERSRASDAMKLRFQLAFPEMELAEVVDEGSPRGIPSLLALGNGLLGGRHDG